MVGFHGLVKVPVAGDGAFNTLVLNDHLGVAQRYAPPLTHRRQNKPDRCPAQRFTQRAFDCRQDGQITQHILCCRLILKCISHGVESGIKIEA